jgi:hypothetical protein
LEEPVFSEVNENVFPEFKIAACAVGLILTSSVFLRVLCGLNGFGLPSPQFV